MNQKILVVGNGWLGNKIKKYLNCDLAADFITNENEVADLIKKYRPDLLINAIGITGQPNIDWCESHRPETYFGNVHIPYLLAEAVKKNNLKLVHLSSGCIYQGAPADRPDGWTEEDKPNFDGSYYSHSKAVAERLLSAYDNILITRIRMPFDKEPSNRNLLDKLLGYKKIINLPNSITVIDDYLKTLKGLIGQNLKGIFNCVNQGTATHQEIIEIYEQATGRDLGKEYVKELANVLAPRSNCVLSTAKLEKFGLVMPDALASVREQIKEYIKVKI